MTLRRRAACFALWALALLPAAALAAGGRDAIPKSWDIAIGPLGEPGPPLVVTGHVVDRDSHAPLANAKVFVYHADSTGRYNAVAGERGEPRLCGMLRTNAKGEYRVRTTMPGGYGGFAPHLHFEVAGDGIAKQLFSVNLVPLRDPESARAPLTPGAERVTRGPDGRLHCAHEIVVESTRGRKQPR